MNVFAAMLNRIGYITTLTLCQVVILIVSTIAIMGCSTLHDSRLSGTFVSDKDATIKYLTNTGKYTEEHLSRIGKLLGKMKVTYKENNIAIVEFEGDKRQENFEITNISSDYTIIKYDQCDEYKIIFEKDGYWLSGGIMPPPYMEKFKRVK